MSKYTSGDIQEIIKKILGDNFTNKILYSIITIVIAIIVYKISIIITTNLLKRIGKTKFIEEQGMKTLITVAYSFIKIIIVFIALIVILDQFVKNISLGFATFGGLYWG